MVLTWLLYFTLTTACVVTAWPTLYPYEKHSKCQNITVPTCLTNDSKYNKTRLPNFIGYTNQREVKIFTEQTWVQELIKTKCSKDLVFLLCSTVLPICVERGIGDGKRKNAMAMPMFPPCRSLCESVYNDCLDSMKKMNISWPGKFNCSKLPDHANGMCVTPDAFVSSTATPSKIKMKLKAACASRKVRRKNIDVKTANIKKYDYIFRVKSDVKRIGPNNTPVVKVVSQSKCTSLQLKAVVTHLQLQKSTCRRKFRRNDGEVLVLVKKGKKQTIDKIVFKVTKDDMKKVLQKHHCSSKKRNNKKQSGNFKG